jgi:hypothetical protein
VPEGFDDHDEICATCWAGGQTEVVEGEEVLSCSFCNEVFHERAECLGVEFFPIAPYECEWQGQSEWCCPKCFEGAKTKVSCVLRGQRPS